MLSNRLQDEVAYAPETEAVARALAPVPPVSSAPTVPDPALPANLCQ